MKRYTLYELPINEAQGKDLIPAIENLIKRYKELEEKDKEHKERITYLQNKITNQKEVLRNGVNVVNLNANRMCEVFELIPKSKVREKIEFLEDLLDLIKDDTTIARYKKEMLEEHIKDFQELLQDKE